MSTGDSSPVSLDNEIKTALPPDCSTVREQPTEENHAPGCNASSPDGDSEIASPQQQPRSALKTSLLVFALCAATFLAALDNCIVSTPLPTIASYFFASSAYIWVPASYLLADAASTPVWGKISDIWGRKIILNAAIVIFFVGSAMCAAAPTIGVLIAGRVIQGVGGGGLLNLSLIIVSDLFSQKDRGKYYGFIGITWALASSSGPLLGGVLSDKVSWRWCFYINLPITALVFVLVILTLDLRTPRTPLRAGLQSMDWIGCLLIVAATTLFLVGLNFGGTSYAWRSATVICLIVIGGLLFGIFSWHERTTKAVPIVPWSIISKWKSAGIYLANCSQTSTMIIATYFLPLYFQSVLGYSSLGSGVLSIAIFIPISFSSAVSGFLITKFSDYAFLMRLGFVITTLGCGLLIDLPIHRSLARIILYQVVIGLGLGPNFQALVIAIQVSVKTSDQGTATALYGFSRNLATSMGLVLGTVVLSNVMAGQADTLRPTLGEALIQDLTDGYAVSKVFIVDDLPAGQKAAAREAFYQSIRCVWYLLTAISGFGLLIICTLKARPMSDEHQVTETGLEAEAKRAQELQAEREAGRRRRKGADT